MYTHEEQEVISQALRIMESHIRYGEPIDSPSELKDYIRVRIAHLPHEVFGIVFFDSQHKLLAMEEMFRGTLAATSVYPREVIKRALELNAGAVAFYHNHPSGSIEPSRADEFLTSALKSALLMVDVRVLDHFIVSPSGAMSFAERGLL